MRGTFCKRLLLAEMGSWRELLLYYLDECWRHEAAFALLNETRPTDDEEARFTQITSGAR